uniref:Uncharacterized protein n=1 Tax=Oryza glumipatula TaxID=40148 RepID=A0A0E0BEH0_9ORYZ
MECGLARAEWGARVKKYLCIRLHQGHTGKDMRFLGWYLKIAVGGAAIGASMELFMIHTGFYEKSRMRAYWRAYAARPEAAERRRTAGRGRWMRARPDDQPSALPRSEAVAR